MDVEDSPTESPPTTSSAAALTPPQSTSPATPPSTSPSTSSPTNPQRALSLPLSTTSSASLSAPTPITTTSTSVSTTATPTITAVATATATAVPSTPSPPPPPPPPPPPRPPPPSTLLSAAPPSGPIPVPVLASTLNSTLNSTVPVTDGNHGAASSSPSTKLIHNLILSYLIHNCYEKTALALVNAHVEHVGYVSSTPIDSVSTPTSTSRHKMTDNDDEDADRDSENQEDEQQEEETRQIKKTKTLSNTNLDNNDNHNDNNVDNNDEEKQRTKVGFKLVENYQLSVRRKMMECVKEGKIENALKMADDVLQSRQPHGTTLRESRPDAYARALCQHYVELIRANDNYNALFFVRNTIRPFIMDFKEALTLLEPYLPLLAYPEPERSPSFELLDVSRRSDLAEHLNGCVVASLAGEDGKEDSDQLCTISLLERILRQVMLVMRKVKDDEKWSLEDMADEDVKME